MHSGGVNKTDALPTAPNDPIKFTPLVGSGEIKLIFVRKGREAVVRFSVCWGLKKPSR
jgi:hypothetical protein